MIKKYPNSQIPDAFYRIKKILLLKFAILQIQVITIYNVQSRFQKNGHICHCLIYLLLQCLSNHLETYSLKTELSLEKTRKTLFFHGILESGLCFENIRSMCLIVLKNLSSKSNFSFKSPQNSGPQHQTCF